MKLDLSSSQDTSQIDDVIESVKRCRLNLNEYGLSSKDLTDLQEKTLDFASQNLERKIKNFSSYRKVDAELSRYADLARRKGLPQNEIDKFIAEHRAAGEAAAKANEKSCHPIDLGTALGPVRNQDTVGWCYAFTAADLLSFKLKKRISAMDTGMGYYDGWLKDLLKTYLGKKESDFSSGQIYTALERAQERGVCLEKNLPDTDNGLGTLKEALDKIESFQENPRRNCSADIHDVELYFPKVSVQDYLKILKTATRADFIKKLRETSCKPRIQLKTKWKVQTEQSLIPQFPNIEKIFNNIDQQLDKNNVVGIAYQRNRVLYNHNDQSNSPHASVVVGRKFDKTTGQCLYRIRNSEGPGCQFYAKDLFCDQGNIWVPKEILSTGVTSVTYLE